MTTDRDKDKDLSHYPMSKLTHFLSVVVTLIWVVVILHPTPWELAVGVAADFPLGLILIRLDGWLFGRVFPQFKLVHPTPDFEVLAKVDADTRVKLLADLTQFPWKRSLYFTIGNFVKTIPITCIVVFYWKHTNSNIEQAALNCLMAGIVYVYMHCVVFFEYHKVVSRLIGRIHDRHDWTEAFRLARIPTPSRDLIRTEIGGLLALAATVGICQTVLR